MLLNVFLSLIVIPVCWQSYFNFDGFLDLQNQAVNIREIAPERVYTEVLDVKITAQSAIAVDVQSGKVLYKKNTQEIRPIASITKLMTALVFLENNPGWQKEFYTIPSDRRNGGIIYLNTGEILTLKDLFYTALIASDNDSAMALSRATGFSEKEFINKMNQKVRELNLKNTHFTDPSGLDKNNKSTAEDIVKLLNFALAKEEIQKATSTAYYEFEVISNEKKRLVKLKNTDLLLKSYLNIIGGKTGHLEVAGYCLAVKVKNEKDKEIIVVVLGSQTNFDRFQDIKAISDWVFTNYQWD